MKKLLIFCLVSLALAPPGAAQSFPNIHRAKDGRAFVLPSSRSKDTSWLRVGGEPVLIEKALKAWPGALSITVNVNADEGYFNAQGINQGLDLDGTKFRYSIDGGISWKDAAWAWRLQPGSYTVRCELKRPGYVVGVAEKTFVIPGKPTSNLPADPKPGGGKTPSAPPKSDEARIDGSFPTDEGGIPQPPDSRLRRVPRLVLPPLTRKLDPDFGSIPAFEAPTGLVTIYQDLGGVEVARSRGWRTFHQHGLPGTANMVFLYNNIFGPDDNPAAWTKFRRGLGDAAELPDLIARAVNNAGGWRGPDGKMPTYIAVDWEIEVQPGHHDTFYRNRGAIIQALRQAYPGSKVGHYGSMPLPEFDGPTDFHMVGDYTILNLWDGKRHFDACENPALWSASYDRYGEWAYQKYNEGRKALRTRSEGKGMLAFWNKIKDGCEVGTMSVRDDIAEGSLLIGILGGMEGVWPWNAHCGAAETNCRQAPQTLTGTRALTAALWRLSQPGIREMLDGNQTYFFPAVGTDPTRLRLQPAEFPVGQFSPPAYEPLKAYTGGADAIWSYHWPDDLPVVVGIRNRGRVALAAVFPRQLNPDALRQVWVRDGDFFDTFTLKGRLTELFVTN